MAACIDYAGNSAAKLVTLLALSTAEGDDSFSMYQLNGRLNDMQAEPRGVDFANPHTTAFEYCISSFTQTGLTEFDTKISPSGKRMTSVRLAALGRWVAPVS